MSDLVLTNGTSEMPLYDPAILLRLEGREFKGSYKDGVSPLRPGDKLEIRPLHLEDFDKGYLTLLKELTSVGDVTRKQFEDRFKEMQACKDTYYITVVEDISRGKVVGSASLIKEQKFIHQATARARVEDVVVSDEYRGKQLGKILVDVLVALSREVNCYKISLECKDKLVEFYSQFGFEKTAGQNFMQQRFETNPLGTVKSVQRPLGRL